MYLHRVFCSTPAGLESERALFEEMVGIVNHCAPSDAEHLLVPVSIPPNISNTEMFHPVIEQNVLDSEFFIQVFAGDWGLPKRNFKPYVSLALQSFHDPDAPMRGVAYAVSRSAVEAASSDLKPVAEGDNCVYDIYSDQKELAEFFRSTLTLWLENLR